MAPAPDFSPDLERLISACQPGLERLDAAHWIARTIRLGRKLGFEFPAHRNDPADRPGWYHACHAEAQLMSFYLDKYYDIEVDDVGFVHDEEFETLCKVQRRRPKAEIHVSQSPCISCKSWRKHIVALTGFQLKLKVAKEVEQKSRIVERSSVGASFPL
ncbi:ankyrin repeat protein [Colletotrichum musicola]|uniref:Ankyrin repeat protein n=1 Tax=Colletotrichum musicola TaxID=2175873 RepID=A0A8H6IU35_9PEZI|nr:ankyrin repeat protein [Colletotrichum musicola]